MNIMPISAAVRSLVFPGSAIISGKSDDGTSAITAYFISGINNHERDRVFVESDSGISITPFTEPSNAENTVQCVTLTGTGMSVGTEAGCLNAKVSYEGANVDICLGISKRYGNTAVKHTFDYSSVENGTGFMLPALAGSDYPFSPYEGEPIAVAFTGSIFDVVADIWENLRPETRVSLWVKSTDLHTGKSISRIINRNR